MKMSFALQFHGKITNKIDSNNKFNIKVITDKNSLTMKFGSLFGNQTQSAQVESHSDIELADEHNTVPEKRINSNTVNVEIVIAKTCLATFILILMVPIIVSDLYFGFNDKSCVKTKAGGLGVSMRVYLLVSGFVEMGFMLMYISSICLMSHKTDNNNEENVLFASCLMFVSDTFNLVWNILGAIAFWGTIYAENKCNNNVSTYIFVTLIIKLLGSLAFVLGTKSKDKYKAN